MSREELLQLKKEIVLLSDYEEVSNNDESSQKLEHMKSTFENTYDKLDKGDQKWVNTKFNEWLGFYLKDSCASGCGNCSCEDGDY
jgi:hypothetical protein